MISISSFRNKWSFLENKLIFVALSGGVDSIVLLRLLVESGFKVVALHVNYNLRGMDSVLDEKFVSDICFKLGVELHIKNLDTATILKEQGGNLQDVARKIRYDFFQEFLTQNSESFIALGHHQDDQIETFFLNVARKSGIRGLACMLEIDGSKIRPLLDYSKSDISAFAKHNNWAWREDVSNKTLKYKRNLLRNKLIPEMNQIVPDLNDSVLKLIRVFQSELAIIKNSLKGLVEEVEKTGILKSLVLNSLSDNQFVELFFELGLTINEIEEIKKIRNTIKGKFLILKDNTKVFKEQNGFSFERFFKQEMLIIEISKVNKLPSTFSKDIIYLDETKVKGELKLRVWERGDRIFPLGMKGSKLVSDVLLDSKLMSIEKVNRQVLVDDDGVIACPFISISKTKVASKYSKNIISVEFKRFKT
jgi:tRNA(Ile)-lysidine synthase